MSSYKKKGDSIAKACVCSAAVRMVTARTGRRRLKWRKQQSACSRAIGYWISRRCWRDRRRLDTWPRWVPRSSKIEFAPHGDIARGVPYMRDGRSAYYVQQNRGKRSLCLDLKNPAAAAIIRELIPKVDVLVENYAPGVIGRLGFGYEAVRALNPKIIMCSISTFGQSGPLANRPGYDFIGCAYSGVLSMIGERDGAPSLPQVGVGDISTGVHALTAIITALLHRERTGEGQYVETSLLDCYFSYNDMTVHTASLSAGAFLPRRNGAHHFAVAPLGVFNGKRSPILIMASTEHQFAYLCRAMGRPELATDLAYCNNATSDGARRGVEGADPGLVRRDAERRRGVPALRGVSGAVRPGVVD